jgi:type VI secretion system protein ImpG
MDDLLPYYERELSFLRRSGGEFAAAFPKIAGRLQMSGDACEDPHIERLIESFALLTARIDKKLDDEYPQLTEALFEVLYPHYLRPFPSCSIAQFNLEGVAGKLSAPAVIACRTELATRPIKGVPCRFRTAYDVTLAPLKLTMAAYAPVIVAPLNIQLPSKATGCISIRIDSLSDQVGAVMPGLDYLRVFIDGDPSFVAAMRDALFVRASHAFVQQGDRAPWQRLPELPIASVGFAEQESLIDFPAHSHPAYRLLTEYFAFPEKFSFFDINMAALRKVVGNSPTLVLHLVLSDLRGDSNQARMLDGLTADQLKLGCTPVVNLFKQRAEPIRIQHTMHSYPVIVDSRRAQAFEVYSIDSVSLVRQSAHDETVTEFRPFYSLRHGEDPQQRGNYWYVHRDELLAERSPGYETEISIVDMNLDPTAPQTDTLSLAVTCTNRDIPASIAYGLAGGDLFIEGGSLARDIRLLRKPTASYRFSRARGSQWRLVSHLSLNHLSLSRPGLGHLKELMSLYDLPRSPISGRLIDGILDLQSQEVTAWLPGKPFASFVRGTEIRLTIDEASFVGSGIDLFARVLEQFFGLYVHANSFVQLVLVSGQSQEELVRCMPRGGEAILV